MSGVTSPFQRQELRIGGFTVVSSPFLEPAPKLQVSPSFEWCTDEARRGMNEWLLARFGRRSYAMLMNRIDGKLYVDPKTMAMLKDLCGGEKE